MITFKSWFEPVDLIWVKLYRRPKDKKYILVMNDGEKQLGTYPISSLNSFKEAVAKLELLK